MGGHKTPYSEEPWFEWNYAESTDEEQQQPQQPAPISNQQQLLADANLVQEDPPPKKEKSARKKKKQQEQEQPSPQTSQRKNNNKPEKEEEKIPALMIPTKDRKKICLAIKLSFAIFFILLLFTIAQGITRIGTELTHLRKDLSSSSSTTSTCAAPATAVPVSKKKLEWVNAHKQPCDHACGKFNLEPVSSGKYQRNHKKFYVCAGIKDGNSGWNLDWGRHNGQCSVAVPGKNHHVNLESFKCLCANQQSKESLIWIRNDADTQLSCENSCRNANEKAVAVVGGEKKEVCGVNVKGEGMRVGVVVNGKNCETSYGGRGSHGALNNVKCLCSISG